jgi:hypothetical protein
MEAFIFFNLIKFIKKSTSKPIQTSDEYREIGLVDFYISADFYIKRVGNNYQPSSYYSNTDQSCDRKDELFSEIKIH